MSGLKTLGGPRLLAGLLAGVLLASWLPGTARAEMSDARFSQDYAVLPGNSVTVTLDFGQTGDHSYEATGWLVGGSVEGLDIGTSSCAHFVADSTPQARSLQFTIDTTLATPLGLYGLVGMLTEFDSPDCAADTESTFAYTSTGLNVQQATTTTLTSSANPSHILSSLTLTATVAGGRDGDSVLFYSSSVYIGTATLSGPDHSASIVRNQGDLWLGTFWFAAYYVGGGTSAPSTSNTLTQVIDRIPTTTALTVAPNPSPVGQTLNLTATISSGTYLLADGTPITFWDGPVGTGTNLGTANLSASTVRAILALDTLSAGGHSIVAVFPGDNFHASSTSNTVDQVVDGLPTSAVLTSSGSPTTYGDPVILTAAVSGGGAPGGTVTFIDGPVGAGTTLGAATLSGGEASISITTLSAGDHSITALYGGDATYAGTTSNTILQVVAPAATATVIETSSSPSTFGQSVTFTATVSPSVCGGSMTFHDGTTTLGSVSTSAGVAILHVDDLSTGTHHIGADFAPGSSDCGSSSAVVDQVVNPVDAGLGFDLSTLPGKAYGDPSFSVASLVTRASGDGGRVTFALGGGSVGCSVTSDGEVSIVGTATDTDACVLVASIAADGGYAADEASASFNIGPATLRVKAADQTIVAGSAVPPASFYSFQLSGWVRLADGESPRTDPVCGSSYSPSTPASNLTIVCSGGHPPANYVFEFLDGVLAVTETDPAPAPTPTPTPTGVANPSPTAAGSPTPTATQNLAGVGTSSPGVTPPPTTATDGANPSDPPIPALLLCLAFGLLGLLSVAAQRRRAL